MIIVWAWIFVGCQQDEKFEKPATELTYNFAEGMNGWEGGFADLPVGDLENNVLDIRLEQLPAETGTTDQAILIEGQNTSDDLFMFLKRKVEELEPSTTYEVVFDIELASQYPETSVGIGGSPGGSVFLKAGATSQEPEPVEVEEASTSYYRMNIDKGNQSQDGADMMGIGTIGIEGEEFSYELIKRGNPGNPFVVTTDSEGGLWLIIGTDSGFEGKTTLYYKEIKVVLKQR